MKELNEDEVEREEEDQPTSRSMIDGESTMSTIEEERRMKLVRFSSFVGQEY